MTDEAVRPVTGTVRFGSYNLLCLFEDDSAAGREHYRLVVETIRELDADVLAVQEIRVPDPAAAAAGLERLAADAGLCCRVPDGSGAGQAALGAGGHGFHVGLMWRDGIEPVPGSLRSYGRGDFWHALALVTLDLGGRLVRHGAHHATPFGRRLRADQNERLVALLSVGSGSGLPVLVGADWNTVCADRIRDAASGDWVLYEPEDPFAGSAWADGLIHHCQWDYDERGRRRHWADRGPGDVLWAGGLYDAAAALRAASQPTYGHYPAPGRGSDIRCRIDGIRVTAPVLPALRNHQVTDTALARTASDHLPVLVDYLPSAIADSVGSDDPLNK
jgi:endonuclease/exonuclease/phosphatase family metal-dependent hydrolase